MNEIQNTKRTNDLSERLTEQFGSGWSLETLKKCRFFMVFVATNKLGLQCGPNYLQQKLKAWIAEFESNKELFGE